MIIFLIAIAVTVGLFIEIFGTCFTIYYCNWDGDAIGNDNCRVFLSWWIWVFVVPYALIKKPALWLVRKLS